MKLYVCWGTFQTIRPPDGHPCHNAYQALRMAGHDPEVVKVRGLAIGPSFIHLMTDGRREVERVSGQRAVPVLITDDGDVVNDSHRIIEWAEAHPAHRQAGPAGSGPQQPAGPGPSGSASASR